MTMAEKTEIGLIVSATGTCLYAAPLLPWSLRLGQLVLICSVAMLVQSLLRDLYGLWRQRRRTPQAATRTARCMCVESTVGMGGVVAGLLMLGAGLDREIVMTCSTWSVSLLTSLMVGFALKDVVFEWNPWRIYRVENHGDVVFSWRRPA